MIPNDDLSSEPVQRPFRTNEALPSLNRFEAHSLGGVALNDPSQGLQVKVWTAKVDRDTGEITVEADDVAPILLLTAEDAEHLSLAFDQNMRPALAYVQNGAGKLWFFNTLIGEPDILDLPGASQIQIDMDDKRPLMSNVNDIICAYIRDGNLYMRIQRDRFLDEYLLAENVPPRFRRMGMNAGLRMQFVFAEHHGVIPIVVPPNPTIAVPAQPVLEIC